MTSIVLVDDDRNILTSVSILLESEGYTVRSYTDGATALVSVPASGGLVRTVGRLDESEEEGDTWLPEVLPDGRTTAPPGRS